MIASACKITAVFMDRDRTLNVDYGYTHKVEDFAWMPGASEALALFHRRGVACFIVTNQGGIGKGLYGEADMATFNDHLCYEAERVGGRITDIAFCTSHPEATSAELRAPSPRRKPAPGMNLELAEKWNVDLAATVMIGDRDSDVVAGQAAGCHAYLFDGTDLAALAWDVVERHFAERKCSDD